MEKIKERKKQAWDNMIYSAQRFDLLIVSFGGAGIYVCLEIIKYNATNNIPCDVLIKVCGFSFILTVILNFLSQYFSLIANRYDYLMSDAELELSENNSNEIKKISLQNQVKNFDTLSEINSKHTKRLNTISMYTLFFGLLVLLAFFITTF